MNAEQGLSFVTYHNGSSRYNYDYSDQELKEFVPVVKEALEEEKQVQKKWLCCIMQGR